MRITLNTEELSNKNNKLHKKKSVFSLFSLGKVGGEPNFIFTKTGDNKIERDCEY